MARNDDNTIRTSSYEAQKSYDRMLADCSISSLRFLSDKYEKDLDKYKELHNLDKIEYWQEYKNMQQRKKMIDEELTVRIMNQNASKSMYETEFDSTTGTLYINDEMNNKHITMNVAFNEDEDRYVSCDENDYVSEYDNVIEEDDIEDKPKTRKEIYDGWKY